jgi:NADPH:quinone reductase-like Zn-dependent oxidoreductase
MRAVVHDRYGPPDVLRLEDVERPAPANDEVLVRVHATTVTRTDCGMRRPEPFFVRLFTGLRRPRQRILGMELAGEVEEVGLAVGEFEIGDQVFGLTDFGANAELVCVPETGALARMPEGLTFEEAAAVCDGGSLALGCLRKADLREGHSILIYGASGSIGTAVVQLAKVLGAEVTAVCGTKNLQLARSLGADHVVDYLHEDFTQSGRTYDVIFDAVGKHSFWRCRHSLKPGGVYVETDLGFLWHVPLLALLSRWVGQKRVRLPLPDYSKQNVLFLKELIEAGRYRAVVDRSYPLEEVVEATAYVETEQKTGSVVLLVRGR